MSQDQRQLLLAQPFDRQAPISRPPWAENPGWWRSKPAIGFGALLLGFLAGTVGGSDSGVAPSVVPGPVKTITAPPPGPKAAIAEDGTWLVGSDIQPGTYRSSTDPDCYWARLKDTTGAFEAIITNGNGGNQIVTVKPTDKAFESTRCAPWTKIR
jgi:hypothetical protein